MNTKIYSEYFDIHCRWITTLIITLFCNTLFNIGCVISINENRHTESVVYYFLIIGIHPIMLLSIYKIYRCRFPLDIGRKSLLPISSHNNYGTYDNNSNNGNNGGNTRRYLIYITIACYTKFEIFIKIIIPILFLIGFMMMFLYESHMDYIIFTNALIYYIFTVVTQSLFVIICIQIHESKLRNS